eukprot:CAMPEP_0206487842 /NCGR_PEP_ID=MMETSP0324_2-20121206/41943_1 /ASSEMBLY_ACC=CAM_ASM_000836 /TAXON_ID=2866 /ORGANISM="Crypthecodinium cohnii, Strain Seligo" /LENGTH=209 /DNA_ID=CAMNT_0053966523 /DNA_START=241 /DNA_END=866 /DNA_ORIENTATION=+
MPMPFFSGEGFQRKTIFAKSSSLSKSIDIGLSSVSSLSYKDTDDSLESWNDYDGAGDSTGTIANRPTRVAHILTEVRKVRAVRRGAVITVMFFQVFSLCCLLIPRDFARWDRSRRDTVSDEAYPACDCATTKYLNCTPELCEINKFDDMMAHLSKVVPDLRQLVAVDQKFILFSRAWCVAELVEASMSEIPQNVEIYSNRPFRANDAEA